MQIIRAQISDMQVATNHMTVIPPFSQSLVTCTIQKSETKSYQLPLETAGLTTYEVLNKNENFTNSISLRCHEQHHDPN
jgi:hypothetical protein